MSTRGIKMRDLLRRITLGVLIMLPLIGLAQSMERPLNLVVEGAWVRLLPPTVTSTALYFVLTNASDVPIVLEGVTLDWADRVEFHETLQMDGMMQMVPLVDLQVAPGETVHFAPGGKHVMIMAMQKSLREGEHLPIVLTYRVETASGVERSDAGQARHTLRFMASVQREN